MDVATPAVVDAPLTAAAATALVFVRDRDSEGVIRQCLTDLGVTKVEFKTGGVKEATAELASRPSPRLLIVDVHGVDDPVAGIRDLANVCDPATGVIVVGSLNDIRLYRQLKAAGIVEYFFTPLVRALVMQSCNGIITGSTAQAPSRTGKLVFVVSARGGAGGTTIAVSTAWHLAEVGKRRVCLLDLDLQFGDVALQLDTTPSHALREALEHPDRVDELFLDRAMAHVGERLGVMAAMEPLDVPAIVDEKALLSLLEKLMRRNRYVFVDVPMTSSPGLMRVLHLPATILLVSGSSLVSARDVARLREAFGTNSDERTIIHVLNKSGSSEGLSNEEFARAAGAPPDVVIPYAREIALASRLGVQGMQKCLTLQHGLMPLFQQLSGEQQVLPSKWRLRDLFGQS